jgi:hypothetical protein
VTLEIVNKVSKELRNCGCHKKLNDQCYTDRHIHSRAQTRIVVPIASAHKITATFQITGRGVAAVIDETIDMGVGKELLAKITRPDGTVLEATAYQEWLLRRDPTPLEKTAFLLVGLEKSQVPIGSFIEVSKHAP